MRTAPLSSSKGGPTMLLMLCSFKNPKYLTLADVSEIEPLAEDGSAAQLQRWAHSMLLQYANP